LLPISIIGGGIPLNIAMDDMGIEAGVPPKVLKINLKFKPNGD
jgi:hypothetical protein